MFKLKLIAGCDFDDEAAKDTEFAYGWLSDRSGIEETVDQAIGELEHANIATLTSPEKRARLDTALSFLSQGTEQAKAYCDSFQGAFLAMADACELIKEQCKR